MSIWGKVIGGVAGFALGGPIGGLLGAFAGHSVDKMKARELHAGIADRRHRGREDFNQDARQIAFTTTVIALSAKMAKIDGHVSADEITVFKNIFHIPAEETVQVGKIWAQAKNEAMGYETYAEQIAYLFGDEPAVMEEILGALMHIAKADGVIHPAELQMLSRTAMIFGFNPNQFERLKQIHLGGEAFGEDDPYRILGVKHEDSDDEIKIAYRKLIRANHPDTLMAQGVPQEFIDIANEKMATINAAYDQIEKKRGLR
ncbi:MAG: molecular chaperone DjlA [Rhodospirillaceae bacterium TMED8]|nr:molecular chaperone DjlA [Magnetovibrio sp.]OUT52290.1 MAG: molecular chaperone DjlA [Rhodospirillaceae bacterium TMED8]|tara:strand:- start:484 stop:1260 length:777 start_codon:yes stop_codon:yes gene_type:complete